MVNSSVALRGGHGESPRAEEARANFRSPVVTMLLRPRCLVKVMPLIGRTVMNGEPKTSVAVRQIPIY